MESPYFTNHWSQSSRRRHFYSPSSHSTKEIPVHLPKSSPAPKVVEIPVQYVSSNKPDRFNSAVTIQKVFRGYLVRKSVKRIDEIRRNVDEIEKRILEKESVEVIRRDANERLRLNESLMSLLFKLDSVLGVDCCVRDFRKKVIKKVIRLQEIIDEIVNIADAASQSDVAGAEPREDAETVGETVTLWPEAEPNRADVAAIENRADMAVDDSCAHTTAGDNGDVAVPESIADVAIDKNSIDVANEDNIADLVGGENVADVAVSISEGFEESVGTCQTESRTDSNLLAEEERNEREEMEGEEWEEVGENTRSRELLERMMEDNERMMGLMTELFERNEMQTRLLSALSQRVGQLEKAFMCERLKKNGSVGLVDCLESTRENCNKKCGGKKE